MYSYYKSTNACPSGIAVPKSRLTSKTNSASRHHFHSLALASRRARKVVQFCSQRQGWWRNRQGVPLQGALLSFHFWIERWFFLQTTFVPGQGTKSQGSSKSVPFHSSPVRDK